MTTTYTFDNLIDDVKKEAQALRVHATEEERGRLSWALLDPTNAKRCVYGLTTGNCYSQRAAELIDKCAITHFGELADSVAELANSIANKPKDFIEQRSGRTGWHTYSAIEVYIQLPEAKNANLIAYLRGESETLDL